jgi:dTDP-4-amino-4,6-dideoxygalactose transaminase
LKIPFYRHDLGEAELASLKEALSSAILTTGEGVIEFEENFAKLLDSKYALGVTSCTGALHMALLGLGIVPGDEVITTPMSFIATASVIMCVGATPVLVDVESGTGNIDVNKIESVITSRTKAIIPVHLYGQMCDMIELRRVADKFNLKIIEDSAHCVEGTRDGIKPGQLSDAACFSFYATKNLTCGEGGAVVTNSEELQKKMILLRLHGMTKTAFDREKNGYEHWDMVELGWKYNMDNIQAAILKPQMERLQKKLELRHELADFYEGELMGVDGLNLFPRQLNSVHARHLFPVKITKYPRDFFLEKMKEYGIGCVVNYRPIHLLEYFKRNLGYKKGDFPVAENIGDQVISIPFYPSMKRADSIVVVNTIKLIMNNF